MSRSVKGFFSYVREVDAHDEGRITRLRERLQGEVRVQTGLTTFEIFQDIRDVKWGDRWHDRLMSEAAGSLFLIPIVAPSYFRSAPCREEYEAFKAMQVKHQIAGVILPIYYVDTDELSDPAWRTGNPWAEDLAAAQWADWRDLRLEPWDTTTEPHRRIAQMAVELKLRLRRFGLLQPTRPHAARSPSQPSSEPPADAHAAGPEASESAPKAERTSSAAPVVLPRRRELIIDAHGRGQFLTVSDALKAASADDVLLVRPGTYREALVIDKSITLLGDGPREEIVLQSEKGEAITFEAPFGRIVNLTIVRSSGTPEDYAVWLKAGRAELEACDIRSAGLSAVAVAFGADPMIRNNRIHDSNGAGINIYQKGRGTIDDNDIFANGRAGIQIRDGADPTVRRNRIHNGKQNGIYVLDAGGTIEDNDIFANALAGIAITTGGASIVRRNRINRNNSCGVGVLEKSGGTFEDNDLRDNAKGPWSIEAASVANVKRARNIEQ